MFPQITSTDFVGQIDLPKGVFDADRTQSFISQYQNQYWIKLVGAEAYQIVSGLPALTPKWNDLLLNNDVVYLDQHNDYQATTLGGKSIIIRQLYFLSVSDKAHSTVEPTGIVRGKAENSMLTSIEQGTGRAVLRYNEAVVAYCDSFSCFVEAYQERVMQVESITVVIGGTRFTVDSCKYLEVGDKVKIDNIEYLVDGVFSETVFLIIGEVEEAKTIMYSPFESVVINQTIAPITP